MFTSLAFNKHSGNIKAGLTDTGYFLDKIEWLQTQDFLNPATNKAIVIYRGTYLRDFNIITLQRM